MGECQGYTSGCAKNEEILHGKLHFLCSVRRAAGTNIIDKTKQLTSPKFFYKGNLLQIVLENSNLK